MTLALEPGRRATMTRAVTIAGLKLDSDSESDWPDSGLADSELVRGRFRIRVTRRLPEPESLSGGPAPATSRLSNSKMLPYGSNERLHFKILLFGSGS